MDNIIILDEKDILEYIKSILIESRIKYIDISDRYHHNTNYSSCESVIKNGILTINDLNKHGITNYSEDFLRKMDDITSHVNGIDGVSLSVVGLTDLNKKEEEYNPFLSNQVDIIVSSDIKAIRRTQNYGNEFVYLKSIPPKMFRTIDIRLFKYIEKIENGKSINQLISYYNCLNDIAMSIKETQLDIPLREMSDEKFCLDIDKLLKSKQIVLKK